MKMLKNMFLLLTVLAIVACSNDKGADGDSADDLEMSQIVIASGPIGGGWYNTAAGLAEILMKEIPGLNVTVNEGGGYENMKLVNEGEAQIGYAFTNDVSSGYEGSGSFEEYGKTENVKSFLSLYPSFLQTVTLQDKNINSYADFGDKNIMPGETSYATVQHVEEILKQYDITYDSIKGNGGKVTYTGYSDMQELLKDGHADVGIGMTAAPSGWIVELNAQKDINFVEIEPDVQEYIEENIPGVLPMEMPANTYDGQTEPVNTLGSYTTLVMSDDVPDDLAEKIIEIMLEHKEELQDIDPALENFGEDTMVDGLEEDKLHEGVKNYMEELE